MPVIPPKGHKLPDPSTRRLYPMGSKPPITVAAYNTVIAPAAGELVVQDEIEASMGSIVEKALARLPGPDTGAEKLRRGDPPPSQQMLAKQKQQPLPSGQLEQTLEQIDWSRVDPRTLKRVADKSVDAAVAKGLMTAKDFGLDEPYSYDDVDETDAYEQYDQDDQDAAAGAYEQYGGTGVRGAI
jgi:hypothetical protein